VQEATSTVHEATALVLCVVKNLCDL